MGRKPRIHYQGAIYHVFNRGNGGKDVFSDQLDYQRFLDEVCAVRAHGLIVHAYCLMPNHFHLLVEVGEEPLSSLMHRLQCAYARYFNYRRNSFGHVFQSRHEAKHCESDDYFKNLVAYIHTNPVAAGLVSTAEEWRWSGHRGLLGAADPALSHEKTLELFSERHDEAKRLYCEFISVERAVKQGSEEPWVRPASRTLEVILADCALEFNIPVASLKGSIRDQAAARCRRLFLRRAVDSGHKRRDIAVFLECSLPTISRTLNASEMKDFET